MKNSASDRRRAPGPRATAWPCILAVAAIALAVAAPTFAAETPTPAATTTSSAGAGAVSAASPTAPGASEKSTPTGTTASSSTGAPVENTGGLTASGTPTPGSPTPSSLAPNSLTPSTLTPGSTAASPAKSAAPAERSYAGTSPAGTLGVADKPPRLPMNIGTKDQEIGRLLWESLAAVLVILLLGGIAIVVVRRVMPRIRIASGKRIILRESLSLGPQKMVHLVQVGSRQLLVGTSRDSVSMLTDVTDTLPPEEPTEKPRKKFVIPPIDDVGDAAAADNAGTAGKDA